MTRRGELALESVGTGRAASVMKKRRRASTVTMMRLLGILRVQSKRERERERERRRAYQEFRSLRINKGGKRNMVRGIKTKAMEREKK